MLVADKYRLHRQIGWSDQSEVHTGPVDAARGVPIAVKIRHGLGGPPRPDGLRARFLQAVEAQKTAAEAGCLMVAPVFESGHEGDDAYYVTRQYPRSLDSLIQGRVTLEASVLHRVVSGVLQALEELRDRRQRPHGNLKPTNVFLDGKNVAAATAVLSDLARPDDATSQGADCNALGETIVQLVRSKSVRNFDWPIEPSEDWERLEGQADAWREFCNVLMSPDLSAQPDALVAARKAFKGMKGLAAAAARRRSGGGGSSGGGATSAPPRRTGLLIAGGLVVAVAAGAAALFVPARDSNLGRQFRSVGALTALYRAVDGPPRPVEGEQTLPPTAVPNAEPSVSPALAQGTQPSAGQPTPDASTATPSPVPTVAVVEATPTPPPTPNPSDRWIRYVLLLQQFEGSLNDPAAVDQPELLNQDLSRFKSDVGYSQVKGEPTVATFLKLLPPKIEATGDQPDLAGDLWTKEGVSRQNDVQSVTYQWGRTGFRFVFNRVPSASGNGPAYYLSATAVPIQFGAALAKRAEGDGKGPLSGAASPKGPVSWEYVRGNYSPRASWMVLDAVNDPFYRNAGRPQPDSPMNGLSGIDALRLARAAGCALPTLTQWGAVLASPSGQEWQGQWQTNAKVRSAQWSNFAKGIQNQHITGAKLPNDQCFGDRNDLSAAGQSADATYFFDPVGARTIRGYSHLIGNVGQYVVDNAANPAKYYFAGGSAEAAPAVFQSLGTPPVVTAPFVSAADAGLRLAVAAKGSGSDKNPALDKLKNDLKAELVRAEKLQ